MAKYRKCLLCGTEYRYCSSCSQDQQKPRWMSQFHDENCKNIFHLCTDFSLKFVAKDAAKEILSKYDLSNKTKFSTSIQETIATILAEDPKPVVEKIEKEPAPAVAPKTVKAPVIKAEKTVKAPIAPKAAKTPVVEKAETIIAPEKAEVSSEVVNKTEEK